MSALINSLLLLIERLVILFLLRVIKYYPHLNAFHCANIAVSFKVNLPEIGRLTRRTVLSAFDYEGRSNPTVRTPFGSFPDFLSVHQKKGYLAFCSLAFPLATALIYPVLLLPLLIAEPVLQSSHPGLGTSSCPGTIMAASTGLALLDYPAMWTE